MYLQILKHSRIINQLNKLRLKSHDIDNHYNLISKFLDGVKLTALDVGAQGGFFNANMFKEVLVANKECETAVLEVSNAGLARINFKVDDYTSTYYMVATKEVD